MKTTRLARKLTRMAEKLEYCASIANELDEDRFDRLTSALCHERMRANSAEAELERARRKLDELIGLAAAKGIYL